MASISSSSKRVCLLGHMYNLLTKSPGPPFRVHRPLLITPFRVLVTPLRVLRTPPRVLRTPLRVLISPLITCFHYVPSGPKKYPKP